MPKVFHSYAHDSRATDFRPIPNRWNRPFEFAFSCYCYRFYPSSADSGFDPAFSEICIGGFDEMMICVCDYYEFVVNRCFGNSSARTFYRSRRGQALQL